MTRSVSAQRQFLDAVLAEHQAQTESQISEMQQTLQSSCSTIGRLTAGLNAADARNSELLAENSQMQSQLQSALSMTARLRGELLQAQSTIQQLQDENAKLRELLRKQPGPGRRPPAPSAQQGRQRLQGGRSRVPGDYGIRLPQRSRQED